MPTVLTTPDACAAWADGHRREGRRIGLVPTMGALHAGHASLMRHLRPQCDVLLVSIFVNPLQFGEGEDLETYPRTFDADVEVCREEGVDAIFAPTTMYPHDFSSTVSVQGLTSGLCGTKRPGHFDGVTTVVMRLFGLSRADIAVFGEKDYQQLAVLRRMTRDFGLAIDVQGAPIVREADGLALSSRNTYLSPDERERALSLSRALAHLDQMVKRGERRVETLTAEGLRRLDVDAVDYLQIVDATTLQPLTVIDKPARILVAAHLGSTRLIDNMALEPA